LPDLSLILLGAGASTRFESPVKKQWIRIGSDPLWLFLAKTLQNYTHFKQIVITGDESEIEYMKKFAPYCFVKGGKTRQESLNNALKEIESKFVLVTDIARGCIPKEMFERILQAIGKADIITPALKVTDTVVYKNETIDREEVKLIQTPQLSLTKKLKTALKQKEIFTDDSSAIKAAGGSVVYIEGSLDAHKITYVNDLKKITCLKPPSSDVFMGFGFDIHPFEEGKKMHLGGVEINSTFGFKAHSDGDVALHALIDALLGAAGAGDIGEMFPDTDEKYKGIDSKILLKKTVDFIKKVGFCITNIDLTIVAQKPRLGSYKEKMREQISKILEIDPIRANIKATTAEKLGFIGRNEGVCTQAVVSLRYYDWREDYK